MARLCFSIFLLIFTQAGYPVFSQTCIRNIHVVDPVAGEVSDPSDIYFEGNMITRIVPTGTQKILDAEIIDGNGGYAIPGLYDMHVHALFPGAYDRALDLMLANGIVGFRDTWGLLPMAMQVRMAMQAGTRPLQRFTVAGNLIDGENPIWPGSNVATTPEEGRKLVKDLKASGAEFIKVYSKLLPGVFFAIADECRKLGIPFMGHVPASVSAFDAANAGMVSMEHMYGIPEACSSMGDSILSFYANFGAGYDSTVSMATLLSIPKQLAIEHQDEAMTDSIIRTLLRNHTWQVPTMITTRNYAILRDISTLLNDPRLKYVDAMTLHQWSPSQNRFVKDMTEAEWTVEEGYYALKVALLKRLNAAGVPIMAGTDPPNPFCLYGFSLHDELEIFVRDCGFTPAQALQTATINPARFMGTDNMAGSIEVGKYADIVLLAGNPLEDINNTREITSLVINGEYLNRAFLDQLLSRWAR